MTSPMSRHQRGHILVPLVKSAPKCGQRKFLPGNGQKEHPNENWARELMELFTVGIGDYTEQDIRESARAFTGYHVNLSTQQFRFAPFQHDASSKTFMGRTGPLDGDDIIDTLLEKPA